MFYRNEQRKKTNKIYTPLHLCGWLTELIKTVYEPKKILDPCAGSGNLTKYFDCEKIEFEIDNGTNFFQQNHKLDDVDLVLCNPPFISGDRTNSPEKFLRHIQNLVKPEIPIIFICPFNFRLNCKDKSSRLRYLETLNITSIISLPQNLFDDVFYHCEILILNLPLPKSHYTYIPEGVEMSKIELPKELQGKSPEEIVALMQAAQAALEQAKKETLKAAKLEVLEVLERFGLSSSDLPQMFKLNASSEAPKEERKERKKSVPKYKIGDNLWFGTGSEDKYPEFVKAELKNKKLTAAKLKSMPEYRNPDHPDFGK